MKLTRIKQTRKKRGKDFWNNFNSIMDWSSLINSLLHFPKPIYPTWYKPWEPWYNQKALKFIDGISVYKNYLFFNKPKGKYSLTNYGLEIGDVQIPHSIWFSNYYPKTIKNLMNQYDLTSGNVKICICFYRGSIGFIFWRMIKLAISSYLFCYLYNSTKPNKLDHRALTFYKFLIKKNIFFAQLLSLNEAIYLSNKDWNDIITKYIAQVHTMMPFDTEKHNLLWPTTLYIFPIKLEPLLFIPKPKNKKKTNKLPIFSKKKLIP
jgi:hypothetical protein